MADTEEKKASKARAEKPQQSAKSAKAERAEKLEKAAKSDKTPKPAKSEKTDKGAATGKSTAQTGEPAASPQPEPRVPARLKVAFEEAIRGRLAEQFGYKNRLQTPQLDKIVVNMGIGEGVARAGRRS